MKNEEAKSLDYQLITTFLFLGSLIISILITYDQKQELLNKPRIFTNKQANKYSIFNRFLVVGLSLSFLFINIRDKNIAKKYGKSLEFFDLQIGASELSVLAAIIVLYVVLKTNGENYNIVSAIENPTL